MGMGHGSDSVGVRLAIPRRGRRMIGLVLLVGLVVGLPALIAHGQYDLTHDIPNPFWALFNPQYAYTPSVAPPNRALYATPPDEVVQQFIADYITVAGTYPCVVNPAQFDFDNTDVRDPVLNGQPCSIHRPVAGVAIDSVVSSNQTAGPLAGTPQAVVQYTVRYADGETITKSFTLWPMSYLPFFRAWLYQTCWREATIAGFYTTYPKLAPKGVDYFDFSPGGSGQTCKQ